jgi:hypothetical protein
MNSNATRARLHAFSTEFRAVIPRTDGGSDPERIAQHIPESVPVKPRKAEMIGHRLSLDNFGGIVVFEGERVLEDGPS